MADEQRRSESGRGGFQRRENRWRDSGDRSWRGKERGNGRSGGYSDDRRGGYRDRRSEGEGTYGGDRRGGYGDRDYQRDTRDSRDGRGFGGDHERSGRFGNGRQGNERRDGNRYGDDRRQGYGSRDDRGFGRGQDFGENSPTRPRSRYGEGNGERGGGYSDQRRFDRGDRNGYRGNGERRDRFDRGRREERGDDRYGNDRRANYGSRDSRSDRGEGQSLRDNRGNRTERDDRFTRGPRTERTNDRGGRFERGGNRQGGRGNQGRGNQPRGGQNRDDRTNRPYSSTEEYVSPHGNEPTIPAGVSAEELDANALRALSTLSGPNKDIVARHLVMAGQLIDLEPEEAYRHAVAATGRAGRVDVVREAAALTAYASGRYEEALREVRAVRRMRGDVSLRAVEADCERGLGHPEKAVEIIDQTDTQGMDLAEQVELILVSSGARADLGQSEVGLVLVDDALAALPTDADTELVRRLMSVKVDRLRELDRQEEADDVEASIPQEIDDPDIVDLSLFADADVDHQRSPLRGGNQVLAEEYDVMLLDLDGTVWAGSQPIDGAHEAIEKARDLGMGTGFITNNAMRTPQMVADKLASMGFEAEADTIMTSAMDVIAIMEEHLEPGAKILVIGGQGVRDALTEAGYVLVASADDEPAAVVQGLDRDVTWGMLTEGALAIERGAQFFATNLDATLPTERGQALGNGSLVRAVQHATRKRPIAAGKPEPGIYLRGAALVHAEKPLAVGDRLETDIMGAVAAGIPAMHVLTGVHQARDIIVAPRGQRPAYLALNMLGVLQEHPRPKHHVDGTWTCGVSQSAKVSRDGVLSLDGVELTEETTISLDSYRALAVASWDAADNGVDVRCPVLRVVDNDDPEGIVEEPLVEEPTDDAPVSDGFDDADSSLGSQADALDEPSEETVTFLPGEEELEELLEMTADLDDDALDEGNDSDAEEPSQDEE
ncbi:HAD-IIA family hydrolase [Schaalia sp. ZJ405]|uniref:HAD-IIA family hydrolase n=1 Tax=Schaalia sp. ZJ405 TaxID=2709403 RepID=UPI001E4561ED|nr:HAD-IIA family hydrolase [Schaalia sp. ZJ405]